MTKVKITALGDADYWYANKTGQIFEVSDNLYNGDYKILSGVYDGFYLLASDCEIVKEKESRLNRTHKTIKPEDIAKLDKWHEEVERELDKDPERLKESDYTEDMRALNARIGEAMDADGITAFNLFPDLYIRNAPNKLYNGAGYEIMEIKYFDGLSDEEQRRHTIALAEVLEHASTFEYPTEIQSNGETELIDKFDAFVLSKNKIMLSISEVKRFLLNNIKTNTND